MNEATTAAGPPLMLGCDDGRVITGGAVHARLLVTHDHPSYASTFAMQVAPGFDVGAHVHTDGEEMFYVLDGEIDLFCFEPVDRAVGDWHAWTSESGQRWLRGTAGAFLYVPPGTPHAFANRTDAPATMFFQSSVRGGHENYFAELAALLGQAAGRPDPDAVRALEARYGTDQLTGMHSGGRSSSAG